MTKQELENRVRLLEQEVAELRQKITPAPPSQPWLETFGMFANDPGFDEIVRLGREIRQHCDEEAA